MPDKNKTSLAQLRVGILGIIALFFITLLIFLLTGSTDIFTSKVWLHAYTSDSSGLTDGAPVRINGILAGKVRNVALSGEHSAQRAIKIDFQVDRDMLNKIPADSQVGIESDNLLGSTKYLSITQGSSASSIEPGATMQAANAQQFDQLVKQGFGVLDSAQGILTKIADVVDSIQNGKGTVGKLLVDPTLYNTLESTVAQVQKLTTTLDSNKGTLGRLINDDTLYKQAESTIGQLQSISQGLQQGQGTAGLLLKDPKLYNDLDRDLNQLNQIMSNLQQGKGTAGQLLSSDKLGNQLSETLGRLNTTLDKVNSGQGTIGQLLVNPQLYDSLNGTTQELHGLLKEIRANPKKYLTIHMKIF